MLLPGPPGALETKIGALEPGWDNTTGIYGLSLFCTHSGLTSTGKRTQRRSQPVTEPQNEGNMYDDEATVIASTAWPQGAIQKMQQTASNAQYYLLVPLESDSSLEPDD